MHNNFNPDNIKYKRNPEHQVQEKEHLVVLFIVAGTNLLQCHADALH